MVGLPTSLWGGLPAASRTLEVGESGDPPATWPGVSSDGSYVIAGRAAGISDLRAFAVGYQWGPATADEESLNLPAPEPMARYESISIVGVGLIGASVGLAAKRAGVAREMVGIGRRAASLRKARECGAVDRTTRSLARGVAAAELVVVCTPVELIAPLTLEAAGAAPAGALLTDAGSTKAELVRRIEAGLEPGHSFVGSHPMAGNEKSGPEYGQADLFDDRVVVVTPTPRSRPEAVESIAQFWKSLGAHVLEMSPQEHDRAAAATSHLPHLAAAALALATGEQYAPLIGSGWRDTTRIAGGDAALWRQILLANRSHVLRSLRELQRSVSLFRTALQDEDAEELESLLAKAKRNRDALGS